MDRHRDLHMPSNGEIENQIWSGTLGPKRGLETEAEVEDCNRKRGFYFSWISFPFFRGRERGLAVWWNSVEIWNRANELSTFVF